MSAGPGAPTILLLNLFSNGRMGCPIAARCRLAIRPAEKWAVSKITPLPAAFPRSRCSMPSIPWHRIFRGKEGQLSNRSSSILKEELARNRSRSAAPGRARCRRPGRPASGASPFPCAFAYRSDTNCPTGKSGPENYRSQGTQWVQIEEPKQSLAVKVFSPFDHCIRKRALDARIAIAPPVSAPPRSPVRRCRRGSPGPSPRYRAVPG